MELCKELNKVINKTSEDKENENQDKQLTIKAPPPNHQPEINAVSLVPKANDLIPENVQDKIVPFEPNWGDEPDFDINCHRIGTRSQKPTD